MKALLLLTVVAAALAIGWLVWTARQLGDPKEYRTSSVVEVEQMARMTFPEGSRLIDGRIRRGWVWGQWAVVEIPPAGLSRFLKQPRFDGEPERFPSASQSDDLDGAKYFEWGLLDRLQVPPERIRELRTVRTILRHRGGDLMEPGGSVAVIVSLDDPDRPRVFLSNPHN